MSVRAFDLLRRTPSVITFLIAPRNELYPQCISRAILSLVHQARPLSRVEIHPLIGCRMTHAAFAESVIFVCLRQYKSVLEISGLIA